MATISETSGEDRIAELKRKMQESAKQAKAKRDAEEAGDAPATTAEADAPVSAEATAATPVADEAVKAPADDATATEPASDSDGAPETVTTSAPTTTTNGAGTAAVAPAPAAAPVEVVEEEEDNSQAEFTRREFLTYAWGAAMGLLAVEAGLVSYFFMYPRFRAGEFGGKFFLPPEEIPALDAPPAPEVAGKFWLVDTDEGPKALYMVCTHLGCLYKWEASNNRFECPCHGSKFSKSGFYIEGPAPRSLDRFEISEENGQVVVDTGAKVVGSPATESPDRAVVA